MYNKKYSSSLSPEQLAELQRAIEQQRKFLGSSVASSLSPAVSQSLAEAAKLVTPSVAQALAEASKYQSIYTSLNFSLSKQVEAMALQYQTQLAQVPDISKFLSSHFSSLAGLNAVIGANFKDLIKVQEIIARTVEVASEAVKFPAQRVLASLATMQSIAHVYNPPTELIAQALQVSNSYQLYATAQLKKVSQYPFLSERIVDITDAAGEFVTTNEIAVEKTLVLAGSQGIELMETAAVEFSHCPPNVFPMVNQHLSFAFRPDFQDKDFDISLAIEKAIPGQVNTFGCKIVDLVCEIDEYSQVTTGTHIFKPTTKTVSAARVLNSYVAPNIDGFADIVDALYFLIYEGAGGSSNRLVDVVEKDNLAPLWRLKTLRNNFRHDVDHGNDIPRRFLSFGEAFTHLIGKARPTCTREWKIAQVNLYRDLTEMLRYVLMRIQRQ